MGHGWSDRWCNQKLILAAAIETILSVFGPILFFGIHSVTQMHV